MSQRCVKCATRMGERDGYENSVGEALCDDCFSILWSRDRKPAPSLAEQTMRALRQDPRSYA